MDVSILTKRYSTPGYAKIIGTLLFPAVFILMLVLPVFEMIPEEQYLNVFNNQGVATGSYKSQTYTIFTMLKNDYHTNAVMVWFIIFGVLAVICGIAFLWMNRPKLAAIPMSVLLTEIIFSIFRSPLKLYTAKAYWDMHGLSSDGASGFVHRYQNGDAYEIFHRFGSYWVLWIAGLVLLVFIIVAIVRTATLIAKKK